MLNISDLLVDAVVAGADADMLDTRHIPHVVNVGCRLQSVMSTEELLITIIYKFYNSKPSIKCFQTVFCTGFCGGVCVFRNWWPCRSTYHVRDG